MTDHIKTIDLITATLKGIIIDSIICILISIVCRTNVTM